jgi:hypothetical protein
MYRSTDESQSTPSGVGFVTTKVASEDKKLAAMRETRPENKM